VIAAMGVLKYLDRSVPEVKPGVIMICFPYDAGLYYQKLEADDSLAFH
jgi:hypothetical protein